MDLNFSIKKKPNLHKDYDVTDNSDGRERSIAQNNGEAFLIAAAILSQPAMLKKN